MKRYDPDWFESGDHLRDSDLLRAFARERYIKNVVNGTIKRTVDGIDIICGLGADFGSAATIHPWQLIDASTAGAWKGKLIRRYIREAPSLDSGMIVDGSAFNLVADAKGYLEITLDNTGSITDQVIVVDSDWWDGYPLPYHMDTTGDKFQDKSYVPIFEFVEVTDDTKDDQLPTLTDPTDTSSSPTRVAVRQYVLTALEMVDSAIDGDAVRLPVPGIGA